LLRIPGFERIEQRNALGLPFRTSQLDALAADLRLNGIELLDAPQTLFGDRRLCRLEHVEQFAPAMRPACDMRDPHLPVARGSVERVVSRERIGPSLRREPY